MIGSSFGYYVVAYLVTVQKFRLVFAKFCVNVAIRPTLPKSTLLSSKWRKRPQPILYENIGLFYQNFSMFGHVIVDCKKGKSLEKGEEKEWEKEVTDNGKEEESALGMVMVNPTHQDVVLIHNEEAGKKLECTIEEGPSGVGPFDQKPLAMVHEEEGSTGKGELGDIVNVGEGDRFPFIQCIEDLLRTPPGTLEKGEIGVQTKEVCKEIKEDNRIDMMDKEVTKKLN